jgi:hypothetical protein
VRGLNTNARAAFEQPIGRIPGEQDLAWDAVSITQIQRIGRENSDFGNVFVRGNVVRLLTRPVPVTSAIVRISSVCRSFTAGRPLRRKRSLLRHHFAQRPWQRPRVPSGICQRPCSNTKHPPQRFRSRLRVRLTAGKPRSPQRQSAGSRWQRADLALESTSDLHSCPFVSIRGSPSPLLFPSRLRVFA